MAVTKRTRFEVLRRDNFTCRYCRSTEAELTIDHVTPIALGGTDGPENLVAACRDCNAGKGSTSADGEMVADVADDALRWAAAIKRAAEILESQADGREEYVGAFIAAWPRHRYLPESILRTVESFYELGLPQSVMVDAAHYAATARNVFDRPAYFAGICWKRVRAMQEIASEIIKEESSE